MRLDELSEPQFVRVKDIVDALRISKPKVFQLLKQGRLRAIKVDGILFIEAQSVADWLRSGTPWNA